MSIESQNSKQVQEYYEEYKNWNISELEVQKREAQTQENYTLERVISTLIDEKKEQPQKTLDDVLAEVNERTLEMTRGHSRD